MHFESDYIILDNRNHMINYHITSVRMCVAYLK